jgi:hypothetical protein
MCCWLVAALEAWACCCMQTTWLAALQQLLQLLAAQRQMWQQ